MAKPGITWDAIALGGREGSSVTERLLLLDHAGPFSTIFISPFSSERIRVHLTEVGGYHSFGYLEWLPRAT